MQAALNGTNLILVDKSNQVGGNANFVEGMFAVNSTLQLEQGIDMQPAEIMEAELSRGQHRQNGDVWLDFVSKSADNITWCIEQGVMYSGKVDDYRVGLFPTFHWFKDGKAAVGYVEPMKARLEELSVQLHLKTAVNGLVMKNGRVIGAYADGGEGVVRYSAKAVVLATGGFGGNEEIVAEQGWNTDGIRIVGSPNAAGDGYRIAMDNGACSFMADSAQSILYAIEAFPPIDFHDAAENPLYGYFGIASGGPVLWVNEACRRYTREDLANDNLALQCLPGKGNKGNYVVFDQAIFDRFFGKNDDAKKAFYDAIKANGGGSIYQSDSLADLAGRFNLDADALKAAVDRYNELCGEGADSDFGKAAGLMAPIETSVLPGKTVVQLLLLGWRHHHRRAASRAGRAPQPYRGSLCHRQRRQYAVPQRVHHQHAGRRVRPSSEQRPRGGECRVGISGSVENAPEGSRSGSLPALREGTGCFTPSALRLRLCRR